MLYDVIVVGAGPAGSTTARECAGRGLLVLLLDKAEFPRDKPCGGGVNVHTGRLLPFSISPVVDRAIRGLYLSVHGRFGFTRRAREPFCYLTQRVRLDSFLACRAIESGVELLEGRDVRRVERYPGYVEVQAGDEVFRGRTLVAADGVNGRTAKLAGIQTRRWMYVAMEGNVTPSGGFPKRWEDTFGLDLLGAAGGYGWIFPKNDHLNIGAITWHAHSNTLRGSVHKLAHCYGYSPAGLRELRGYRLPVRRPGSPLVRSNILLVGDAAGFVDPWTAEGLYGAIRSGKMAATHLVAYCEGSVADLQGYAEDVDREITPETRIAWQLYDLFYLTSPLAMVSAIRWIPGVWESLAGWGRGEDTYSSLKRKLGPLAGLVDYVSDLRRASPKWRQLTGLSAAVPPERFDRRCHSATVDG